MDLTINWPETGRLLKRAAIFSPYGTNSAGERTVDLAISTKSALVGEFGDPMG